MIYLNSVCCYPPLTETSAGNLLQVLDSLPEGGRLRLSLKVGDEPSGAEKLRGPGLEIRDEDGKVIVDMVAFASVAEKA